MMAADREALVCDLAETYGIFDMQALPARKLATLASGLREDSRIKMHVTGEKIPRQQLLLAAIADRLSLLIWMLTEDGKNGVNRPSFIVDALLGTEKTSGNTESFTSPEAFEAEWARRTGVSHHG